MIPQSTRRLIAVVLSVCTLLSVMTFPAVAASGWTQTDSTRLYVATDDFGNLDDATIRQLDQTVALFVAEYFAKLGKSLTVKYGEAASAGSSDLVVSLVTHSTAHAQGYAIDVIRSQVTVNASGVPGIFYGLRHVLKSLITEQAVSSVPFTAPSVDERAVSLDNGRKYFSVDWIKQLIREMSWNNMNTLVLHFSEEMGLGIESKQYPWLAGRDDELCTQNLVNGAKQPFAPDEEVLTHEEVKEIVAYAALYQVEIVPSLDSPGHMNYIVRKFNEKVAEVATEQKPFTFTLDGKVYEAQKGENISNYYVYAGEKQIVSGTGNAQYSRGIDISNEIAVAFTKSLLREYGELFREAGCTKFDIGGDELLGWNNGIVNANQVPLWSQLELWEDYAEAKTGSTRAVAYDAFVMYINDLNRYLRSMGYTSVRMWNDNAHVYSADSAFARANNWKGICQLDSSIDIWYWTNGDEQPENYHAAGHEVYNILSSYTYYVLTKAYLEGNRGSFNKTYPETVYNEWTPFRFSSTSNKTYSGNVIGGAMGIWCDYPILRTEAQMMTEMLPLLRAIAVKSWDAQITYSYKEWTSYLDAVGDPVAVATETLKGYIPDNSELLALIAEGEEHRVRQEQAIAETGEPLWAPRSFDNYMAVIDESEMYLVDLAKLATVYTQANIDDMCAVIKVARNQLFSPHVADRLIELVDEYDTIYYPQHLVHPYTEITWNYYAKLIATAREFLLYGTYDPDVAPQYERSIVGARDDLIPSSSDNTHEKVEGLVNAYFQTTSVRRGRQARLIIQTKRDINVQINWSCILLPDGTALSASDGVITELEEDPNQPDIRTYYVVFPANLSRGKHTFTIRGIVETEQGIVGQGYTDDEIECTITIR